MVGFGANVFQYTVELTKPNVCSSYQSTAESGVYAASAECPVVTPEALRNLTADDVVYAAILFPSA